MPNLGFWTLIDGSVFGEQVDLLQECLYTRVGSFVTMRAVHRRFIIVFPRELRDAPLRIYATCVEQHGC
jgi:hypothetical protein